MRVVLLLAALLALPLAASDHNGDHVEFERVIEYGGAGAADACHVPAAEGLVSTCVQFGRVADGGWFLISEHSSDVPSFVWTVCFFDEDGAPVVTNPLFDSLPCEQLNDIIVDSYETYIPKRAAMAAVGPVGGHQLQLRVSAYFD